MLSIPRKKPRKKNPLQQLKLVKRKSKFKIMYRLFQEEEFDKRNRKKETGQFAPAAV